MAPPTGAQRRRMRRRKSEMAVCSVQNPDGQLVLTTTQPEACAGYLLITPSEYQKFSSMSGFFYPLTAEQGALIAFAIVGVWVSAFCIKSLMNVLPNSTGEM
ncbi:hypothetical protein [Chromobacterium haemolyticum]|uniref:hypothetical protein n=1 Tax=Chromobacterium haemolyticum TaxID=394935 RepID=UPI002446AFFE|nr:hypothetical protein [Chromobacterium haemolyticum]MDH0340244.1 hypothetical protein [Chromobacterium haemolyticum]